MVFFYQINKGGVMALLSLSWFDALKLTSRQRIACSPLVVGCKGGDRNYIRALMVIFWEFVDDFPEILFEFFSGMQDNNLIQRQAKYLAGITDDEKNHRRMWLQTSEFLGLPYTVLQSYKGRFPLVGALSRHLREHVSPAVTLLRIVGVEIVAEMLSVELLNAGDFHDALNERARVWFEAHDVHEGTTHEQIALRLALVGLEADNQNSQEVVTREVLQVVDIFIEPAKSAPEVVEELVAMGMAA